LYNLKKIKIKIVYELYNVKVDFLVLSESIFLKKKMTLISVIWKSFFIFKLHNLKVNCQF